MTIDHEVSQCTHAGADREGAGRCISSLVLDSNTLQQAPQRQTVPDKQQGEVQRHKWMYTFIRADQSAGPLLPHQAQPNQAQAQSALSQPDQAQLGSGALPHQAQAEPGIETLPTQASAQAQHRPMNECGFAEGDMLVLSIEGMCMFHISASVHQGCALSSYP